MKQILKNETQKKWALTGFLMVALGFNLSAPIQQQLQELDLASMDPKDIRVEEIEANDGSRHKIHYVKQGEGKTLVHVPYALEGRSCANNGVCHDIRVLDVPFSKDAKELESELRKLLAKDGLTAKKAPSKKKSDEDAEEIDEKESTRDEASEKARRALDKALSRCDRKDGSDQVSCLSRVFIRGLKQYKLLTKEDALELFRSEVLPSLRRLSRDHEIGSTSYIEFADALKDMEAGLPRGHNRIRDELNKLAKDIVAQHATRIRKERSDSQAEIQTLQSEINMKRQEAQMLMRQDPQSALMAQQEAMGLQQQMLQLQYQARNQQAANSKWLQLSLVPAIESSIFQGLEDAASEDFVDKSYVNSLMANLRKHNIAQIRLSQSGYANTQFDQFGNSTTIGGGIGPTPLSGGGTSATIPSAVTRGSRGAPVQFGSTRQRNPNLIPRN